jgi:hypothetical protein
LSSAITIHRKWFLLGILNLSIVALLGGLMRYKMAFNFPFFVQNNLLHAHSHFAFSGWVSHILFTGLTILISTAVDKAKQKKYNLLIIANLCSAFGMLVAFTIQGYKAVSITFSTLSLIVAVTFAFCFIRDSKYLPRNSRAKPWAVAGLIFNALSVAGPFTLAYVMASKSNDHELNLASIHYFLHFQYNGWFFFGSMALVTTLLPKGFPDLKGYFKLFALTVIPTFFLSVPGFKLPAWLYIVTAIAALLQLMTWLVLLTRCLPVLRRRPGIDPDPGTNLLFYTAAIAMTIKFALQALSVIPSMSQLLLDYRAIVIAYLHLVLLGIYSLFIIGYFFRSGIFQTTKMAKIASTAFFIGVLLNELFLGIQSIALFTYIPLPYINEMLFSAALLLLGSAVSLALSQTNRNAAHAHAAHERLVL